jgi:hypothetical protein
MSVMFVSCEGDKWVNLAHVAVIVEMEQRGDFGCPRFELLGPDKSRLGIAEVQSVTDLIAEAIP